MDDGLMSRPWLPIEPQDDWIRPKLVPDAAAIAQMRFAPRDGSPSHEALSQGASKHEQNSLEIADPAAQITSLAPREQAVKRGLDIRPAIGADDADPRLMGMDDVMHELSGFLGDGNPSNIPPGTLISPVGTTETLGQGLPCASSALSSGLAISTAVACMREPGIQPCDSNGGPSRADGFETLSACSMSDERMAIKTETTFASAQPAGSTPQPSRENQPTAQRAIRRKSRKRNNESELHKKNEAEKKRIKRQADIILLLRDELVLHVDTGVCDPRDVSRNDLLEMSLQQLTKERQSRSAHPSSLNDKHMYNTTAAHRQSQLPTASQEPGPSVQVKN